jgi:hypothetical protein
MQKVRGILFDLDHVAKVTEILKGTVAPLPTIAEEAPMLAALVGIGRIARPESRIWAFVFVENGLRPIGHELHSPCHRGIAPGDEEKVKSHARTPYWLCLTPACIRCIMYNVAIGARFGRRRNEQ